MIGKLYRINVTNQSFDKIGEFEFLDKVSFSQKLNGVGKAEFTLPDGHELIKNINRYSTALLILRDGVPVWVGYIRDIVYDANINEAIYNFFCVSWFGFLTDTDGVGRYTDENIRYVNTAQETIAWNLINDSQNKPNGWLGIVNGTHPPTVNRDRSYNLSNIGQMIINLSNVINGFDFDFVPVINSNKELVNIRFDIYQPKKGKLRTDLAPFNVNLNLNNISIETREPIYNYVYAEGSGTGSPISYIAENAASQQGYTRIEKILSEKDVSIYSTLVQKADAELQSGIVEKYDIKVTQIPGTQPDFFLIDLGDWIKLQKDNISILNNDVWLRIVEKTYSETTESISYNYSLETQL